MHRLPVIQKTTATYFGSLKAIFVGKVLNISRVAHAQLAH